MKILCGLSRYQFGIKERGETTEYIAFLPALANLGYEVVHFETCDPSKYPTYADLNHALLAEVLRVRPQIVLTVQRDYEIWTETLLRIRELGDIALVTWTTDDSFKFNRVSKYIGPYYDAVSTTYEYRLEDYSRAKIEGSFLTQWAANAFWLKPPKLARDCQYAVSFVGSSYGGRAEIVRQLQAAGIDVKCFGYGWPGGPIPAEQIPDVMNDSVISLNFCVGFMGGRATGRQVKARTFEVPGAGGFLLTDAAPGLDSFYQIGEEIEVYGDLDDLRRKINYYLLHLDKRDKIARAGHVRTMRCHTYELRLRGLLEFGLERRQLRLKKQGLASVPVDSESAAALPLPKLGTSLKVLRWLLVRTCCLVWGPQKGIKAARRAVFESSLRICGARTFSAMSVPGRMFSPAFVEPVGST
jgi:spore maturation protein CgeB